jgi:hypothetical protein
MMTGPHLTLARIHAAVRSPSVILTIGLAALAPTGSFGQTAARSYPWGDLNVPVAGRRYVYTGIVRNPGTGVIHSTAERVVEYTSVEGPADNLRFVFTDRVTGNGALTNVFYDVRETRRFTPAGESMESRFTTIPGAFGSDAPQTVSYASGLIAPPLYTIGQSYNYTARFSETTIGGNEVRQLTVSPLETVTVPAGTFRCVKVGLSVTYQANVNLSNWGWTLWYARNVGVVKAVFGAFPSTLRYEFDLQSTNFPLVAGVFEAGALRSPHPSAGDRRGRGPALRLAEGRLNHPGCHRCESPHSVRRSERPGAIPCGREQWQRNLGTIEGRIGQCGRECQRHPRQAHQCVGKRLRAQRRATAHRRALPAR